MPQPIDELCHSTAKDNLENLAVDSPQRLFIEQQLKWLTNPSVTARRWHPMIVRWALLLHKKSKSAYRYIRDSALVCLPSEGTLSDYRCYKPLSSGVDTPCIFEVAEKFGQQDVTILIDEMKVSAGLTYSVSAGELCGYVDSLDADTLLDVSQSTASPDTASHALCFMARGLKSNLQPVVATYGESIVQTESAKLLGVTIDQHLNFNSHIDTLIGKSRAAVHGLLTLKRKGVTPSMLTKYYQACIFPILTYASPVWHSRLGQNSKDKLERHQSLCLKLIHPTMPSYTERLQVSNISRINDVLHHQ